ncbi:MAG: L,D-transpeptidase family protein [Myxococcota bacterium]
MSKGYGKGALLGAGLTGVLVGFATASFVLEPAPQVAQQREEVPPIDLDGAFGEEVPEDKSDPLRPVLDALTGAHATLHGASASKGADTSGSIPRRLKDAIAVEPWQLELRQKIHQASGAGRFVSNQGLTPLGKALLEHLMEADRHGLDPETYQVGVLTKDAAAYKAEVSGQAVVPPPAAGPAGAVMVSALESPVFDRASVAARLRTAGGLPAPEHVGELLAQMKDLEPSPELQRLRWKLEAGLGAGLLRYVLDFKFLYRAGPFKLVSGKTVAKKKSLKRKLMATIAEIVMSESPGEALDGLQPNHPAYARMLSVYETYRGLADKGGCKTDMNTESWRIKPGDEGERIKVLQERLACEGYYDGPKDGIYGDGLLIAVRDFQRHHELDADGYVYESSLKTLNISMEQRVRQIKLALQRLRESRVRELGDYYVRVNVPAFELQVIEKGEVIKRHKVIVGTNRIDDDKVKLLQGHINRTDLFVTKLYQIISNPDWYIPKRVEAGEIKARVAEDPEYLAKKGITTQTLPGGRVVYVQKSGAGNALGKVKFLLRKSKAIFLHDTDKKDLFKEERRDLSHGCIRVHKATKLAQFLLEKDGWDAKDVARSIKAKSTQRGMSLKKEIDIITEYITVDIAEDGKAVFLTDIYKYDRDYYEKTLPPNVTARWGSSVLRPHWVPKVPEEIVEDWRSRGQPAPHNYKPPGG